MPITTPSSTSQSVFTDFLGISTLSLGPIIELVAFEKADEVVAAYDAGRCDVYTTDRSGLAAQRTKLTNPDAHVVLPEIISK